MKERERSERERERECVLNQSEGGVGGGRESNVVLAGLARVPVWNMLSGPSQREAGEQVWNPFEQQKTHLPTVCQYSGAQGAGHQAPTALAKVQYQIVPDTSTKYSNEVIHILKRSIRETAEASTRHFV